MAQKLLDYSMIKTARYGTPTNHIQKLEFELKQRNAALDGLNEGIRHLVQYLNTDKFYKDSSVNVDDVINRILDARFLSSEREHNAGEEYIG